MSSALRVAIADDERPARSFLRATLLAFEGGCCADIESSIGADLADSADAPVSVTLGKTPMRTDESGIVLTCRSLDANWSSTVLRGEGLLLTVS